MEFSVALVEQLFGKDKAENAKGPLVMRSNSGDEYTIIEINTVELVSDDPPKVLVPIANGSEEMETISIVDVLQRAKAEVVIASMEDTKETGGLTGAQKYASSETLVEMLKNQKSLEKTLWS
ncbi:hypothetical protein OROHE_015973 [Orobanche hederae]